MKFTNAFFLNFTEKVSFHKIIFPVKNQKVSIYFLKKRKRMEMKGDNRDTPLSAANLF